MKWFFVGLEFLVSLVFAGFVQKNFTDMIQDTETNRLFALVLGLLLLVYFRLWWLSCVIEEKTDKKSKTDQKSGA
ncbi:hypothetical protein KJ781_03030 [Patescibacteria group bacterium]|nr:hypothetical protein [Patescibacteria group bacterium]MBU1448585.1 hypothetical protein [Patescibacteria group bacterium]MBU2613265.1 hypothetical protein [Patescibacteria group bacterium]